MASYYSEKLAAERLQRVYEVAPPRVKQYLRAEIDYVLSAIDSNDWVLELGCGYGRVLAPVAGKARMAFGVDISRASLDLCQTALRGLSNCHLIQGDAANLGFKDNVLDKVICIQNGISAFHVDRLTVISEAVRVTKRGGLVLFSSYCQRFWSHRLEWFRVQSDAGLLGEIDWEKSRDGAIVCKDGFTATTVSPDEFRSLAAKAGVEAEIVEVDDSSLFCRISTPQNAGITARGSR